MDKNEKRMKKYQKKISVKPSFVKLFLARGAVAMAIAVVLMLLLYRYVDTQMDILFENAMTKLPNRVETKLNEIIGAANNATSDENSESDSNIVYDSDDQLKSSVAFFVDEYANSAIATQMSDVGYSSPIMKFVLGPILMDGEHPDIYNIIDWEISNNDGELAKSGSFNYLWLTKHDDDYEKREVHIYREEVEHPEEVLSDEGMLYSFDSNKNYTGAYYINDGKVVKEISGETDVDTLVANGYTKFVPQALETGDVDSSDYSSCKTHYFYYAYISKERSQSSSYTNCTESIIQVNGVDYKMQMSANISTWYDCGARLTILFIIIAAVALIIALIMTVITYNRRRLQYENDQYRKKLTDAMAHDLKSPLTAIAGYVQNLKENVNPDKNEHYMDATTDTVDYMNGMIENILNLSKTDQQIAMKKNVTDVSVGTVIDVITQRYEQQINEKSLEIVTEGQCIMKADESWITQGIDNIITNIIKYGKENTKVYISLNEHNMTYKNEYSNELNNKSEKDINKLLEPFVKGDNARHGQSGSGVGLSIVKNIFEAYGWNVSLKVENDYFIVKVDKM